VQRSPEVTLISPSRAMLALALPVLAEEALNLMVGYTDWFLAGHYLPGDEPLAAMSFVSYFLWIVPSLFAGVGIGALAVIARLVGGGDRRQAAHVARQALFLGCGVALVGMALISIGGPWIVHALQLRGEAAELALRYVRILTPAIPFVMLEQVGSACLRGAGDTVTGMFTRIVLNIVNIAVSTSLITGAGPLPALGFEGLAIGAVAGHTVGGLIVLYRLASGRAGLALLQPAADGSRLLRLDWPALGRILRIGLPGGFDVLAVLTCHLIYVAIINRLGTTAQAAHGLGVQIEAMSYLPGSAFQVAAATLAGQSLGAADQRRAVRGVLLCAGSALAIMTVAGLVLYFGGGWIAGVFTGSSNDTARMTGQLLKIVALSCPSLAILMVLSGALRGSGDTRWTLAITFIGLVGVRLPGACWLAWSEVPIPFTGIAIQGVGLGVAGAWYAMIADVILRSLLMIGRFWHGGWQSVRV
jgi:putative MATE family efflux protein